jgi:hypothetical protein
MKKTIAILSAFFLLTQGTAMAGWAGRDRSERGRISYENRYDCSRLTANTKLKLTVDQANRISVLDEEYWQEIEPILEQFYEKRQELKAEWLQMQPDRSRIEVIQSDVAKMHERMRSKFAAHRANILKIPEQQEYVPDDVPGRHFYKPGVFH